VSVVVSAVAPGFNAETYEAVTGRAMPGEQLPDGCKLHIAGPVEQGWRVITVWESREAFDRFREEMLIPAIREITGEQAPPAVEPEVNPVHKLITS
jgi:heme-degrading monooxygenase HmoA